MAWPPQGYIPYQVVPKNSKRWSFSYSGAIFTNASVVMQRSGTNVTLALEAQAQGYGDNTIVWVTQGVPTTAPAADVTYSVTVSNVMVSGTARVFNYNVTIIDPYLVVVPDPTMTIRNATNKVLVAWPSANTGYTLQRTQSPETTSSWMNVAATPQITNSQFTVTLNVSTNREFYRLRK